MDIKRIVMLSFVVMICMPMLAGNALCIGSIDRGISADMLNQDPDPVKPGEVLEVRLAIENNGYDEVEDCIVEIEPEYPFRSLSGEPLVKNVGTLVERSSDGRSKVVKFKLRVENDVNAGKYPLTVKIYEKENRNGAAFKQEFLIDIDSESNAEIEFISLEKLAPGTKTNLTFGVKNVGNSPLKNAMFSWESSNDIILPVGSSNVKHINFIDIGETANVTFEVLTNVHTKPGLYKMDMILTYDDIEELQTITEAGTVENQKRKEIRSKAGIYIGGDTDFDVAFVERSPVGDYTFSVSNIGNNIANSVKISVPEQANWSIRDGPKSVILGNLQKGDYTIADFNLDPYVSETEVPLKFEITYTSSDGQRQVDKEEIKLYTGSPISFNSETAGDKGSSYAFTGVALVLVGAVGVGGFLFYRKQMNDE